MPVLQLGNEDARIVALAITYHLGRPGSETDRETLQRHDFGLASVGMTLAPRLEQARVDLEVTPYQLHRLDEALLGTTNELKQYEIAQRRSTVPGFAQTLGRLFPDLDATAATTGEDGHPTALDLVERVVLLRRRLGTAVRAAEAALEAERAAAVVAKRAGRPWWRRLLWWG